jgi:hypothetical protein
MSWNSIFQIHSFANIIEQSFEPYCGVLGAEK